MSPEAESQRLSVDTTSVTASLKRAVSSHSQFSTDERTCRPLPRVPNSSHPDRVPGVERGRWAGVACFLHLKHHLLRYAADPLSSAAAAAAAALRNVGERRSTEQMSKARRRKAAAGWTVEVWRTPSGEENLRR